MVVFHIFRLFDKITKSKIKIIIGDANYQVDEHEEKIKEHKLHVVSHIGHGHPMGSFGHQCFPTCVWLLRLGRHQPTVNGDG